MTATANPDADADAAMDRYATGENDAFSALYDAVAPRLYAFCLRRTRDRARAEDIVQQTLLQMHEARGSFVRGSHVMPWAIVIAQRLMIDGWRRDQREAPSISEALTDIVDFASDAPDDRLQAKELVRQVEQCLAELPQEQRLAFELVKGDGLSLADAADVLGTTVMAVKLRTHRVYNAIRSAIAGSADRKRSKT